MVPVRRERRNPDCADLRRQLPRRRRLLKGAQRHQPRLLRVGQLQARGRVGEGLGRVLLQLQLGQRQQLAGLGPRARGHRLLARDRDGAGDPQRGPGRPWRSRRSSPAASAAPARASPGRRRPRASSARPGSAPATDRTRRTRCRSTGGRRAAPSPPTGARPASAGRAAAPPPRPAPATARAVATPSGATRARSPPGGATAPAPLPPNHLVARQQPRVHERSQHLLRGLCDRGRPTAAPRGRSRPASPAR